MILNFCSSKWNGEFRILERKDIELIDIRFRRLRHVIFRIRNAQFYQLLKLKSERINKQFRIYFRRVEEKQGERKCREYRRSRSIRFQAQTFPRRSSNELRALRAIFIVTPTNNVPPVYRLSPMINRDRAIRAFDTRSQGPGNGCPTKLSKATSTSFERTKR